MPAFRAFLRTLAISLLTARAAAPASAVTVQLDYSLDSSGFFSSTPLAKSAVDAAAADVSALLTTVLAPVPTDVFTGTNGDTTATFNWSLTTTNPGTGGDFTLNTFSLAANTVRLYVGMRNLTGTTLGEGGPGGGGFNLQGNGFSEEWVGAVTSAQNSSNATMGRGDGPIMGTLSGSSSLGGTTANYTLRYGSLVGSLSLDRDTNNDGTADNASTLASFWHYDPFAPVAAGKNDMYSVALHEILHAIGMGTAESWDNLVSGTNWTGPNAIALRGSGTGLVTGDGHIAAGIMSTRLSDGVAQEVVMDPNITVGTRKVLTALDAAFLRDIGWDTIPEPGTAALLLGAVVPLMGCVRRRARADARA